MLISRKENKKHFNVKILEVLKMMSQDILNEKSDHIVVMNLKSALLDSVIYFNRFHSRHDRVDSLKKAVEFMDDAKFLLKLAVELKCIDYDLYKKHEDLAQQVVRMMVAEIKLQYRENSSRHYDRA